MNHAPLVTVIIPTRPEQKKVLAVEHAQKLNYPPERVEILLARGRQPSKQRNAALTQARGEIVYFLDDDSVPAAQNLLKAVEHFIDPEVQMVGGPNLCPATAPPLERAFACTMGTWLAFGPSAARYRAKGAVRSSSEKELILCNLAARRATVLELGGFNEALYPNEENALMDEVQKRGRKLVYDPTFIVHRRPRSSLSAFIRMLRTYGRGRAEQFRLHPSWRSAPNFIPPLFCLWLVFAAGVLILPSGGLLRLVAAVSLLFYILALLVGSFFSPRPGFWYWVMPLTFFSHIFYGLGFWHGLFTRIRSNPKSSGEVQVETVT